jgi:hypothetical protein
VTPQDAIEAAELVEAETAYRNQLAREMTAHAAAAEYERGLLEGYLLAVADLKAFQHAEVRDAELEIRRYGPGGRAHFGDPRPGDFPGRDVRQPEPELEAEIA